MHMIKTRLDLNSISKHWRNGAWTEPAWFLRESRLLDDAGFPLHLRQRAADQLAKLYPTDVCAELLHAGHRSVVMDLFTQVALRICPLLELGLDLEVVGFANANERELVRALRSSAGFHAAAVELSVWANLKREGFEAGRDGGKLHVKVEGARWGVEVKSLGNGDYDALRRRLSLRLEMDVMAVSSFPGKQVTLRPTEAWEDVLASGSVADVERCVDALRYQVVSAAVAATRAGEAPGRYRGQPYVELHVEDCSGFVTGVALDELLPPESAERRAARAQRLVRHATQDLERGTSLVVLDADGLDPFVVHEGLLATMAEFPQRFDHCELFIIRGVVTNEVHEPLRVAFAQAARGAAKPVHLRLADAVSFRHFRDPFMSRHRRLMVA